MEEILTTSYRSELPQPQFQDQRPQKEVDKLLENLYLLLTEGGFIQKEGLLDAIYSKRHRKQVWDIVKSMMSHDYVESCDVASSNGDILRRKLREEISRLADSRKRLIEYEKKYGVVAWYDSISYPVPPSSLCDMPPRFNIELVLRLQEEVKPLVYCGMQQSKRPSPHGITKSPDVVSLLSSGDDSTPRDLVAPSRTRSGGKRRIVLKPDTFRSKYVLVFCINLPVLIGPGFQSLLNLCNELSLERAVDCEMVMVARMNILADTEQAFNDLFSLFPKSCLAVPYEDWNRRECIWKALDCGVYRFQCFVYDTNGSFLKSFNVNDSSIPYGAEAFPFTEQRKKEVLKNRNILRKGGLENLLRPYESSSPVYVYEFNPPQERLQRISKVIKNKHVGLYVCCRGLLIPRLRRLCEQCKRKSQEFEIVVLYLPMVSKIDPALFKTMIDGELRKHNIHRYGWWCLPFNNSVSLRLWGLTKDYECSLGFPSQDEWDDKLIIVGPDGKILDMYGAKVLDVHGHVYPFTREAVAKKKAEKMRKKMCLKLLLGSELFRGRNPKDTLSADELLGRKKKIIIYMGRPNNYVSNGIEYDFPRLVSQYEHMKKRDDEFEVVFIEYEPEIQERDLEVREGQVVEEDQEEGEVEVVQEEKLFSAMPWYVLRHDDRGTCSPLTRKLTELFDVQSLVGFGEDGRICSVKILQRLFSPKTGEFDGLCLDDTLKDDIHLILHFTDYRDI